MQVSRAVPIGDHEHHKQRCGVDTAIVAVKRHFTQHGHLALPCFMQNLAGLRVGGTVEVGCLRCGEKAKNAPR